MEHTGPVNISPEKSPSEGMLISDDAVVIKDSSDIIISWNRGAEKVFGFTSEEALGQNISLIIPENKIAEENQITNLISNGIAVNSYYTVRSAKGGRRVHVMLSLNEVTNDEGDVIAIEESIKDITAQRTSEEKQGMLAAIVDSSQDAIISKDFDGIITSWNKAAEKLFGYKEEETIGKPITILIPKSRLDEEFMIISKIRRGEKVDHFETVRRRKDGSQIWVSLTISPVRNYRGEIIGASKIARDITQQRKSEERQDMLAALVDSSDDAIISKDLSGIITSWNKGAEKIFGYNESEVVGKHINLLIPIERRTEETVILSKIHKGEKVEHFETERLKKSGKKFPISITVSPIKNSKGEIIGASKIGRDISQQIEEREQLKVYSERLERLNSYKDDFIGMASHELKTPLTNINANLQILERKLRQDENVRFVSKALKHVGKFTALINELLDVTKIQSGQLKLHYSRFNFEELIRECIDEVQSTSTSHAIILSQEVKIEVSADRERIEQVLINLLSNAVKYSPLKDKVLIRTFINGDEIGVSVQDFGIGIPEKDLNRVFSRYFRVEGLEPTYSGLGIGLYICYNIVRQHNGKMWVESKLSEGSTFYFTLPLNP